MDMYKTFFASSDEEKLSIPHNYLKSTQKSAGTFEHLWVRLSSSSAFDVCPNNPPQFRQVLEEMASHFTKLGVVLERIISECLGLPPDFLANYTNERSQDALMGLNYFPAKEDDNTGKPAHEDPGCFTIVYQYEVGGLQVQKDGQWIPIAPQFTKEIGESPKYRGFHFDEYLQLRHRNRSNPPARPEDFIHITDYLISS